MLELVEGDDCGIVKRLGRRLIMWLGVGAGWALPGADCRRRLLLWTDHEPCVQLASVTLFGTSPLVAWLDPGAAAVVTSGGSSSVLDVWAHN